MRRIAYILGLMLLAGTFSSLWAQTDKDKKKKAKPVPIPVYLANQHQTGTITVDALNAALGNRLTGRDSAGKTFTVTGFAFTYVERNMYEDSVGNLKLMPDYLTEYCFGDTLSTFLRNNIKERSKAGDTVYIDKIDLKAAEGWGAIGKGIKLTITR